MAGRFSEKQKHCPDILKKRTPDHFRNYSLSTVYVFGITNLRKK